MRTLPSWFGVLGTLALAGLPAAATAQPVGSEFQVNTFTTNSQSGPSIASDVDGDFVVVWESIGQDGGEGNFGIFGQRYDSEGVPQGGEFRVNSFTTGNQEKPAVASDGSGNFVVVWHSDGHQDGDYRGVFGQRYDSSGVVLGDEFQANSYTPYDQQSPAVASDATGNFVVVWMGAQQGGFGYGIFGQRYDSEGRRLGTEFRVNYTRDFQWEPAVASDASGNFVVVWQGHNRYGGDENIFGQRYDSEGVPQGGEFRVNSNTQGTQASASVASDASGNFVVIWTSTDGNNAGVFGKRYHSSGAVLGSEFRVNSYTTDRQDDPSVASDADGNFVVAWASYAQDGSGSGVFGQRYDSSGAVLGSEFRVNSYTTSAQTSASVASDASGNFAVVWDSRDQDGSFNGIFAQRFSGGPSTMHVGDLDRRAKNVGASWRAQVKTLVHDAGHDAVGAALVTLDVSGVGARSCTTTAGGVCEVSVVVPDSVPSLTFTVMNLSKTGFSYDAGANHDPDPDSNGTVIVVNQP